MVPLASLVPVAHRFVRIVSVGHVELELTVDHRAVGKCLGSVDAHSTVAAQLARRLIGVGERNHCRLVLGRIVVVVE